MSITSGNFVWAGLIGCVVAIGSAQPAAAVNPADESYQPNEARRLALINGQLGLNDRMLWLSGLGRPYSQPVGHVSGPSGPQRWIYRPLYAAPVQVQAVVPAAVIPTVELPGPSDRFDSSVAPQSPVGLPKPSPPRPGPREF